MSVLPTVDLRRLAPSAANRGAALRDVRDALGETGAFYLIGHEIESDLSDRVLAATRAFFALPQCERSALAMVNSPHFRGYTAPGNELTQGRPDWREELDIGLERPARFEPGEPAYWGLQGPNQWPAALPELRPVALEWIARACGVAEDLARALAEALGLARAHFDDAFAPDPHVLLKLVHYPGRAASEGRQGVGEHRDSGFLTLVLQDDRGGSGLQFFDGSRFVDVEPRRGAFVVNLGEAFELATGRRLRATLHRVQSPPAGHDYFSVPFFFNPRFDYVIEPLPIRRELFARRDDVAIDPADPIFAEYGYNALKGRLRSHRDVARRFYRTVASGRGAEDALQ